MERDQDQSRLLQNELQQALGEGRALRIAGGDSKRFYGNRVDGEILSTRQHRGIIAYEPSELVLTARAGTPLRDIEAAVAASGQMLGFEPPHFGAGATLGGAVASGLSGPRRAYSGALRDFVLGAKVLNGRGEILQFGGQVMKNVAGYDIARLMAGSLGCLGVILEVSLKLLPRPEAEQTLCFALNSRAAAAKANRLLTQAVPLSGACYSDGRLFIRLSGAGETLARCAQTLGGDGGDSDIWAAVKEQTGDFFSASDLPLWRLSVPPATDPAALSAAAAAATLWDWGGALHWIKTRLAADEMRAIAATAGGHATLFRSAQAPGDGVFQPLLPGLKKIHSNLKQAMDPHRLLNPGRMYADF